MTLGLGLTYYIPYSVYFVSIIVILLSIFKPKIGIFFMVPLIPFQNVLTRVHQFPFGKDIIDILFLFIIIGWAIKIRDKDDGLFIRHPYNKYALAFLAFSLLSLIFGYLFWGFGDLPRGGNRFLNWKNYAMLPIIYFMCINIIKTKKDIMILVFLIILSLLFADYHYYLNFKDRTMGTFRWEYKDAGISNLGGNELAAFYAHYLFIPLCLFIFERKKLFRFFYAIVAMFTLYPILYLFSRGAYLGVLFGLLSIGIIKKSKILILTVFVFLFVWQAILPTAVVERIQMTETEEGGLDSSAGGRLDLWVICLKQFLKNPIGSGFNTYEFFGKGGRDPHSTYFEILSEQGVIGLWVFLSILYLTFRNSVMIYRFSNDPFFRGIGLGLAGSTIAVAVTNLFGDRWTYIQISVFFWTLMALVMRVSILTERDKDNLSPGM